VAERHGSESFFKPLSHEKQVVPKLHKSTSINF